MKKSSGFNGESTFAAEDTTATDTYTIADGHETIAEKAVSGLAAVTDQVKDTAHQTLEQGQQVAGQAIDKAKDSVKSTLSNQKEKAVSTLGNFTDALLHTGDQLRQSGQGVFGGYADTLADRIDHVADYLRENDIDDLTAQVESFARKQPAIFIGGAFVLGIAVARFLKSSQSSIPPGNGGGSGVDYNTSTLPTPASAGALTTTTGEGSGTPERGDQFSDKALPDTAPLAAHGYVTGIGVGDGETSDTSETSTFGSTFGSND